MTTTLRERSLERRVAAPTPGFGFWLLGRFRAYRRLLAKIGVYLITLWAAVSINFLLPRVMPGDPTQKVLDQIAVRTGATVPPETVKAVQTILGNPKEDLWQQYLNYWASLSHLDFGISTSNYPVPVIDVILGALPWTLLLVVTGTIVGWILGTGIGLLAGWVRGSRLDQFLSIVATVALSAPGFWVALIILWLLGYQLGWFPYGGAYDQSIPPGFSLDFIGSVLQHLFLPVLAFVLTSFAGWTLSMRNQTAVTTLEDYVLLGKAKGLPSFRTMLFYAGRNAVLPNATGLAQAIGHAVGGVVLIEVVFSYPGIGTVLVGATQNSDLPLMQGVLLLVTVVVLFFNLISDLVNTVIDPRTKEGN